MSIFEQERPQPSKPPVMPPNLVRNVIIGIFALVIVGLGFTMFYTVQEQERAVILTFGKYSSETGAGLHMKAPWPIQSVQKVPANKTQRIQIGFREEDGKVTAVTEEAMMITGDENIVSADAVVEYNIANTKEYLFEIENPEHFLRNAAAAAIRSVMGTVSLDYAITEGKTQIQADVKEKLKELVEVKYDTGIHILDLKFQDIEPPGGDVENAFREVTNAREEKNTKINNARKYENEKLPKARGEAQANLENAEAQKQSRILNAQGDVAKFNAIYNEYAKSPQVTKSRLILETLEAIMPNAKIFITDSSGDTVKYMPINEMLKTGTTKAPTEAPAEGGAK